MKHYYEAYEDRYQTIHALGHAWSSDRPTPIVGEILARYGVPKTAALLELGCGEGRDALPLLRAGWNLLATDISPEAIAWCRRNAPDHADRFQVLDCLGGELPTRFDFIYAVAVLHMLTEDGDRARFFAFLREHLTENGLALVCTMGDGEREFRSDPAKAFDPAERDHPAGPVTVAATTCRMVSFETLERELRAGGLAPVEKGLTPSLPDFDCLMYAVLRRAEDKGNAEGSAGRSADGPGARAPGFPEKTEETMRYQDENAKTIDRWVEEGWEWGVPIGPETCAAAKAGRWDVLLTPTKPVPHSWFGDLRGKKLLGLASGGGQQIPIFAALGALCTVLDYSERQLESERRVAEREGYEIEIVRGDMTQPLPFADGSFDLIFHPVSNCYVEEVEPIWRECFRVLKPGGVLLAGLDNGLNFLFDGEDETKVVNSLPFNPLKNPAQLEQLRQADCGVQFSHTLDEQIGGQLRAGFRLTALYEDTNGSGRLHELNIPAFLATRAVKP